MKIVVNLLSFASILWTSVYNHAGHLDSPLLNNAVHVFFLLIYM